MLPVHEKTQFDEVKTGGGKLQRDDRGGSRFFSKGGETLAPCLNLCESHTAGGRKVYGGKLYKNDRGTALSRKGITTGEAGLT